MLYEFKLKTDRENMHDITPQVWEAVQKSGIKDGTVTVFAPHTTAAITINENADPDVVHDMLIGLCTPIRIFQNTGTLRATAQPT